MSYMGIRNRDKTGMGNRDRTQYELLLGLR